MRILNLEEIKSALKGKSLTIAIADAYRSYSEGKILLPPVGEILLSSPPGEVHIKSAVNDKSPYYAIKIASGFCNNSKYCLPVTQGLILLFSRQTGKPEVLLNDECYLTNLRTAVSGSLCSKTLAASNNVPFTLGVIGSGVQAKMQIEAHIKSIDIAKIILFARDQAQGLALCQHFSNLGLHINLATDIKQICSECNLIVTTTPSKEPLIRYEWVRPGTHITAIGSDTPDKIELDPMLLHHAEYVVCDSKVQATQRGEVFQAIKKGVLSIESVEEIGSILARSEPFHRNKNAISVCDLTGIGALDLAIAETVLEDELQSMRNNKW